MTTLRVSHNKRFLVRKDGTPFFYLGDTAWELFHRLSLSEAEHYLRDRAAKRFTVIQAVVLAELDGLNEGNARGDLPLQGNDPTRPNETYFAHVDAITALAGSLGLYIGMLPTWGDKWNIGRGAGPEVFTPDNARVYGEFLGRRYRDAPVIWILGGDRAVESERHLAVTRAMAEGLREGDGGEHLMTFHPRGGHTSAEHFHHDDWLDFNMWQSGHSRNRDTYACIAADYALTPTKPCLDGEPGYEDHPAGFRLENGYLDDYDTRKALYWALFAGALGHTYGCHPIWQMWRPGHDAKTHARRPWHEALHLPGSVQMQHARALLESRPFFSRIPDPSLIVSGSDENTYHVEACRDQGGRYALIYIPTNQTVSINLGVLRGNTFSAHWFDPRTGAASRLGEVAKQGSHAFTPPVGGPDWVLVLDDSEANFLPPGSATYPDKDTNKNAAKDAAG